MGFSTEQLVMQRLLSTMAQKQASDLHLSVGNSPTLRINGQLLALNEEPILQTEFVKKLAESILSVEQKQVLEKVREITISHNFLGKVRFRVHVFYQQGFISLSLRQIKDKVPSFQELGLPPEFIHFVNLPRCFVIVTGAFGSGRTTTLSALVGAMNATHAYHVVTLEKPIEQIFIDNKSLIEQREIGKDTPTFVSGLNSVLNEDINCVMISDIPDGDTIMKLLEVAESGKIVYAGLSAPNVISALENLINSVSPDEEEQLRSKLARNLTSIIALKLIPSSNSGVVPAIEMLTPDDTSRNSIREGSFNQLRDILEHSRTAGTQSFDRALVALIQQRKISVEKAIEHATDPRFIQSNLA
ncbi:MAG: hypothetical protein A3F54_00655 [Candidatus Kerfeldbacteria bacterium RIFCSPHIGHO2_12_FULL_48_17]|uniref:Bacterial type II secretion system protein E domain-containing protein n=1 Tax=Candidatus Kerfeldbacteria bacterium RIFCSPHIGHO2_12_FULL_48_17 TaxID=1798542 RepID=A0A1G2B5F7_9BACT|nr:MAG: hypothetical protein A3F54_00655 [Candidatus Kerfeldbacteria bacterium RIFCSPHIGHO2_12_FULL_48_17]